MKNSIFVLLLLSLFCVSCEKDPIDNTDPAEEVIPPDNGPITTEIIGEIEVSAFDEGASTSLVRINRIPHSLNKFLDLQDMISQTPQGAAVMMIVAFRIYQQYPVEGKKCLTAAAMFPLVVPSNNDPGAYQEHVIGNISELTRKLNDYPHLPYVYYQGASPENQYEPEAPPYEVDFKVTKWSYINDSSGGRIKVFVNSEAADSSRPVTVKKDNGIYKVTEFSSLYLAPKPIIN